MSAEKPAKIGTIPTLLSPDCDKHIAWIKTVFGAQQESLYRSKDEKTVMHCSLIINQGYIFLCDRSTSLEKGGKEPEDGGDGTKSRGTVLHLELEDPSPFWKTALNNGATVIESLKQQYWGAEYGSLRDPFGFVWGFMKGGECRKPGVIPYLTLEEGKCQSYVDWLVKAFDGEAKESFPGDNGLIQHCCVKINGGFLYLADDIKMPEHRRETSGVTSNVTSDVVCHLDVPNPKALWEKLIKNEAESVVELKVQFWGDLYGTVRDKMGYQWSMCEAQTCPPNDTTTGGQKARGVISYIVSPDCEKHVQWIETVLGGEVKNKRYTEAKKVMHCVMSVNGGTLMICDRQMDCPTTTTSESSNDVPKDEPPEDQKGFMLHMNVPDPDLIWKKAMANGGVQLMELKQQFWGDYYGMFQDPFGYQWSVLKSE